MFKLFLVIFAMSLGIVPHKFLPKLEVLIPIRNGNPKIVKVIVSPTPSPKVTQEESYKNQSGDKTEAFNIKSGKLIEQVSAVAVEKSEVLVSCKDKPELCDNLDDPKITPKITLSVTPVPTDIMVRLEPSEPVCIIKPECLNNPHPCNITGNIKFCPDPVVTDTIKPTPKIEDPIIIVPKNPTPGFECLDSSGCPNPNI